MKLIPHDSKDYAYTVNFFQAGRGGTLKMRLSSGEVRTIKIAAGGCVNLPVKRIYRSGTTAADFQTDLKPDSDHVTRNTPVPFAGPRDVGVTPSPDVFSNLEAYYRLEGDGTDNSGNARTLTGSGTFDPGIFGQGTSSRDGEFVTSQFSRPNDLLGTGPYTVAGWFKCDDQGASSEVWVIADDLLSSSFRMGLRNDGTGMLRVDMGYTESGTSPSTFTGQATPGEWHHIALSVPATGLATLYLDGVEVTKLVPQPVLAGNFSVRVFTFSDLAMADEVCVYSRSLTAAEVGILADGYDPTPQAGFTYDPQSGFATLTVAFTDTSTGTITDYSFDPGDGSPVLDHLPATYDYSLVGQSFPSLTVTGPGGVDTYTPDGGVFAFGTPPPPPPPPPPLSTPPEAYYRFQGNAGDSSGNGHDMTGTSQYGTGRLGDGFVVTSGATRNLSCENTMIGPEDDWTVCGWFYCDPQGFDAFSDVLLYTDDFVTQYARISLRYSAQVLAIFELDGESFQLTETDDGIAPATWHHLAITRSGTNAFIYVNGSPAGSFSDVSNVPPGLSLIASVGRSAGTAGLDELAVYSRVVSFLEMSTLAGGYDPTLLADLGAYYRFDGDLTDSSGNGFTISDFGAGESTYVTGVLGQARSGANDFSTSTGVSFSTSAPATSPFTLFGWMRRNSDSAQGTAAAFGFVTTSFGILRMGIDNSNNLFFGQPGGGANGLEISGVYTEGEWVHLALRSSGDGIATAFVNGVAHGTTLDLSTVSGMNADVMRLSAAVDFAPTAQDECGVYLRALPDCDIAALAGGYDPTA